MLNADQAKLQKIGDVCRHPGAYHWSGRKLADVIVKIIEEDVPIPYRLSDIDKPIDYAATHDATWGQQ